MTYQHSSRVQQLIDSMQKAAEAKFAEAKEQKDAGMMACYAGDARDMFKIAEKMQDGDFKGAREIVREMDTAARDEVPNKVYEFLNDE